MHIANLALAALPTRTIMFTSGSKKGNGQFAKLESLNRQSTNQLLFRW